LKAALGWVQNVLDLKDKFDTILKDAFALDKDFEKTINDVCRHLFLSLQLPQR
jgi:cullin 3